MNDDFVYLNLEDYLSWMFIIITANHPVYGTRCVVKCGALDAFETTRENKSAE